MIGNRHQDAHDLHSNFGNEQHRENSQNEAASGVNGIQAQNKDHWEVQSVTDASRETAKACGLTSNGNICDSFQNFGVENVSVAHGQGPAGMECYSILSETVMSSKGLREVTYRR